MISTNCWCGNDVLCIPNIMFFRLYGIFHQMLLSARFSSDFLHIFFRLKRMNQFSPPVIQSENLKVKCIHCKMVWSLCYPQFSCVKVTVLTHCPPLCFITTGCQQQHVQNSLQILFLILEPCLPKAAEERHKLKYGARA